MKVQFGKWGMVLALLITSSVAGAGEIRGEACEPRCIRSGGGGGIPTPLTQNQKVELAHGEQYVLAGWVRFRLNPETRELKPMFEVDFELQPWLGSAHRRLEPQYALALEPSDDWKKLQDARVKIQVRAEGRVIRDSDGEPRYEIRLEPVASPELMKDGEG